MGACLGKGLNSLPPSKVPIIWVLGGPGSGRGMQCARLVHRYGFHRVSSGTLLREHIIELGEEKERELKALMDKGAMVPDDIVMDLVKAEMQKYMATAKGFLIDGCPREIQQATDFEEKIAMCSFIIFYECPDEVLTMRLKGRDTDEGIKTRLATFHQDMDPLIEQYAAKVVHIDATKNPDTIFRSCVKNIDHQLKAANKAARRETKTQQSVSQAQVSSQGQDQDSRRSVA